MAAFVCRIVAITATGAAISGCSLFAPDRDEFQRQRPNGCGPNCESSLVSIGDVEAPYKIEPTEVTNAAYQAFLASAKQVKQPDECMPWNDSFQPGHSPSADPGCTSPGRFDPTGHPNLPVVCVDWCDAWAYCAWTGRRLCGRIGGGWITQTQRTDPNQSQWFRACTRGDGREFPYKGPFDESRCNTASAGPATVGTFEQCQGGYDGLYDMSGNVQEWEDNCELSSNNPTDPSDDHCTLRGGAYWADDPAKVNCAAIGAGPYRNAMLLDTGFRCCSDD